MKKLILLATAVAAICGCTNTPSGDDVNSGQLLPLEFTTSSSSPAQSRVDGGHENLTLSSHVSLNVFKSNTPAVASFIDSRYLVSDKQGTIGLMYNNNITAATARQKIIEVTADTYDIYAIGVNDGSTEMVQTLASPDESISTYATENGKEYLHATTRQVVAGNDPSTRQVKLSFTRQVAMVQFTVVGSPSLVLPSVSTATQVITAPKMKLPVRSAGQPNEGIMHMKTGITEPLTGPINTEPLSGIYPNAVGEAFGMYYYVLPTDMLTNPITYDLQFTLAVDNGSGTVADRIFDVRNIPLPTMTNGNRGFEKGKRYTYTITINNTGLYISEVQVKNWDDAPQNDIVAQ